MATRSYTINGVVDSTKLDSSIKKVVSSKTYTIKVQADGTQTQQLSKQIQTVTDKSGNATKTISQLNKKTGELQVTTLKTNSTLKNTSVSLKDLATNFTDIIKKVTLFGSATAIIGLFTSAIVESIQTVKDFDKSLTELQKVQDFTSDSLKEFTSDAINLGEELSRSANDVVDSVTQFKKSGYDLQEAMDLSKSALMMQNTADAMMTSSETASALIAVMKGYNLTAEESMHITDAINKVSEQYAVSSADLTSNIQKVASTLNAGNTTFEETVGLMTAITEVTRNASQSAMALKTISQRIRGVGEDGEDLGNMTGKLQKAFDDFGISIQIVDENTQEMASTYDILKAVSEKWYDLTDAQRQYLGEQMAGKLRITQLNALMQNFQTAIEATDDALYSAGTTARQFGVYEESLEGKTNALKIQFQKLVIGDGGLTSLLKVLVSASTVILKFINDTDALKVLFVDLSIILAIKLIPKFVALGATLKANAGAMFLVMASSDSLSVKLQALGITASTTQLALGGLVAVLTIGLLAFNKYKASQEEARQEAISTLSAYKDTESQLESLVKQVQDENASKESLIATMSKLDSSYDTEKAQLKDINDLRQEAIEKLYEEARVKAQQTVDETGAQASKARDFLESSYDSTVAYDGEGNPITPERMRDFYKTRLDYYKELIDSGQKLSRIEQKQYEITEKEYNSIGDKIEEATDIVNAYDEANNLLKGTLEDWLQTVKETEDEVKTYDEILSDDIATTDELADVFKELNSQLDTIQSMFDDVDTALQEYNENGYISIDTYQKLLSYGDEYLGLLLNEQNQIDYNTDSVNSLYEAKVNELAITKARQILDTAEKNTEEGTSFRDLASSIDLATASLWEFVSASVATKNIDATNLAQAESLINQVDEWRKQTLKGASAQKSSARATKSNTNAIKEQTEALKEQKTQYDKVISYIKGKIKDYIDTIEDARDKELDAVDDRINALKKQQDIEEQYWQDKIDALEAQNDAIESQMELEQLLDNLEQARATKKKVYREGQGFVYEEDKEAVSTAQTALQDYYRKKQYEDQLAELNKYKDNVKANYEQQIADLEAYQDQIKAKYQAQIDYYNNWLDEFQNGIDAYDNEQNRLLALQMTGIDFEAKGWETRLYNLQSFVNQYNALLRQIGDANAKANSVSSMAKSSSIKSSIPTSSQGVPTKSGIASVTDVAKATNLKVDLSKGVLDPRSSMAFGKKYATGTYGVRDDQIAVVGDNPSANELVVGSKLNGGTAIPLKRNTGVIPHNLTTSLVQMASAFNSGALNLVPSSTNNSQNITIGNISLPSVQNGQDFVDYLQNFSTNMTQLSYNRT